MTTIANITIRNPAHNTFFISFILDRETFSLKCWRASDVKIAGNREQLDAWLASFLHEIRKIFFHSLRAIAKYLAGSAFTFFTQPRQQTNSVSPPTVTGTGSPIAPSGSPITGQILF